MIPQRLGLINKDNVKKKKEKKKERKKNQRYI